jgi:hypothetical protein
VIYRPCPIFRPTFTCETDLLANTIIYRDPATGFSATFDAAAHKLVAHTRQDDARRIKIQPAIDIESKFVRRSSPASVLMSGDKRDTTKAAGSTGGGRRTFISVAFERALLGFQDGYDALYTWALDQGQRPTAWQPFTFKYTAYYGKLGNWQYDTQDADGWSIFRADHLESAQLYGGAAMGEDLALAMYCELLKWVSRTFWNPTLGRLLPGWTGSRQARAMGWVPWFLARASLLGFDGADDAFVPDFLGVKPKQMLKACVTNLRLNPPRLGENKADDRTMVVLPDGSGEIRGDYPFQHSVLYAAVGWIQRSGLLTSSEWNHVLANTTVLASEVCHRAIGAGGMSYAISATDTFDQADVDLENATEKDKSHVYELFDGCIRDKPRLADAEMLTGALAYLFGPQDSRCRQLLALLPKPTNMAKYDDLARYMDPAYALADL